MSKQDLEWWTNIYKGLGNQNRLKILKLLNDNGTMSVSELSEELEITLKNTSRNLQILLNLDLVEFQGRKDHVYYRLSRRLPEGVRKVLNISVF